MHVSIATRICLSLSLFDCLEYTAVIIVVIVSSTVGMTLDHRNLDLLDWRTQQQHVVYTHLTRPLQQYKPLLSDRLGKGYRQNVITLGYENCPNIVSSPEMYHSTSFLPPRNMFIVSRNKTCRRDSCCCGDYIRRPCYSTYGRQQLKY